MPEIVTKYPEVLIQELKSAGGKCGENVPPRILIKCPSDQFCVLPSGEICVYDLNNFHTMTQVNHSEWLKAVGNDPGMVSVSNLILLLILLGLGLIIGMSL